MSKSSLAADLLPTVDSIALHIYGEANPSTIRRCRHLIEQGKIPIKKLDYRVESRKSWIDQLYAKPDR